jgi:hypothetical protein
LICRHAGATCAAVGFPLHKSTWSWCAASCIVGASSAADGHHLNFPDDKRL